MSALTQWLDRARDDEDSRPSVDEALLGGGIARYAVRRLRYVLTARLLGFAVHLVELALLVGAFSASALHGSLVVHNAFAIAAAAWWGCLEVLRARIRAAPTTQDGTLEASRWMRRARLGTIAVAAATVVFCAVRIATAGFGLFDAFVAVLSLRFAADLSVRTYHSGIYASRRVYRPLTATVFVELVGLGATATSWWLVGPWSLPIAMGVSAVVNRWLVVHYARRSYRGARIPPPRAATRKAPERLPPIRVRSLGLAAAAGAAARAGSFLVIAAVLAGGRSSRAAVGLHVIAPLLATAATWAHAFYIDFAHLSVSPARRLAQRLSRQLLPVAVAVGIAVWVPAAAILGAKGLSAAASASLLTLFVAQSLFALTQLERIARHRFSDILVGATAFGIAVLPWFAMPERLNAAWSALGVAVALSLATLVTARLPDAVNPATIKQSLIVNPLTWLTRLSECEQRVAFGRVELARGARANAVASAISDRLGVSGEVVVSGRSTICWFEQLQGASTLDDTAIVVAAAGLATRIESKRAPSGSDAVATVVDDEWLGALLGDRADPDALMAAFRSAFPDGLVEDLREPSGHGLSRLSPAQRRQVWKQACRFANSRRSGGGELSVSAFVQAGEIALLFAIPETEPAPRRAEWAAVVRAANLREAAEHYGNLPAATRACLLPSPAV